MKRKNETFSRQSFSGFRFDSRGAGYNNRARDAVRSTWLWPGAWVHPYMLLFIFTLCAATPLRAEPADEAWSQWRGPANGTAYVKKGPGPNLELAWTLDIMDPNNDLKIDDSLGLRRDVIGIDTQIRAEEGGIYVRLVDARADKDVWKLDPATGTRLWSVPQSHGEIVANTNIFQLLDTALGYRAIHVGGFYGNFWTFADVATGTTAKLPELADSHSILGRRILMGRWAWNNRDYNSATNPSYFIGGRLYRWNGASYEPHGTPPFALYDTAWDNGRLILFAASGWPPPYTEARLLELDDQANIRQDVPINNIIRSTDKLWDLQGMTRLSLAGDFTYAIERTTDKVFRLVRRSVTNGFAESGAVFLHELKGSPQVQERQRVETTSITYAVDGSRLYLHRADRITAYTLDLSRVLWEVAVPPRNLNNPNGPWRQTMATDGTWLYHVCDDRLQVRLATTGDLAFEHVFQRLPWKRQSLAGAAVSGKIGGLAVTAGRLIVGSTDDSSWIWTFRPSATLPAPVIAQPDDMVLFRKDNKPLSVQLKIQKGMGPYTWTVDPSTDARLRSVLSIDASGRLSGWTPQAQDVGRSFTIAVSVSGLYGRSATRTFRVRVDEARVTQTLVNFGASPADDVTGVPGFTKIFKEPYMKNRASEGPAGFLLPSTATYSYAGVSGIGRRFQAGDEIQLTLYNRGKTPVYMSARLSFETEGRYNPKDVSFRDMLGDTLDLGPAGTLAMGRTLVLPGRSAVLRHVMRAEEAGQHTLVNVLPYPTFTDPKDTRTSADWVNVFIDKLELLGAGAEGAPPSNNPPIAADDVASVPEDGTVAIPVLANDLDPDGDSLRVASVTQPQNGAASAKSDGTVTYLPKSNFSGTDTFSYTVADGRGGENTPRVTVSVAPVNDAPVARFTMTPSNGTAPLTVTFDARTSSDIEDAIKTYAWNFGDGQNGTGARVSHTYTAGGSYTAKLTVTDSGGLTATHTMPITIAAPPPVSPLATISVAVQDTVAMEGRSNNGTFQIRRTGGSTAAALEVLYTVSGSAQSDVDYRRLSGTATIPAGATSVDIALVAINDHLKESEESVTLTLKAKADYKIVSPAKATIRLLDDETPSVWVVTTDGVAWERGTNLGAFSIRRSGPLNTALTVNYTMSGTATSATDYTGPTGNVTLAPGQTSIKVPIQPIKDTAIEVQETVTLTLTKSPVYQITELNTATVFIED